MTKPDYSNGPTWDYTSTYLQQYETYEDGIKSAVSSCLLLYQDDPLGDAICQAEASAAHTKPDENENYQSIFMLGGEIISYNEQTRWEILEHLIPARTEPLGQAEVNLSTGEIGSNPQMRGFTDSNQDHSAPYHGFYSEISQKSEARIQQRAAYWNTVLTDSLGLPESEFSGLKNTIENP